MNTKELNDDRLPFEYIEKVVSDFIANLINFRCFINVDGVWVKSDLMDLINYPFVDEYIKSTFSFLNRKKVYNNANEEMYKVLNDNEINVIGNIGSCCRITNPEEYQNLFSTYDDKEIDFIIVNLTALYNALSFIQKKVQKNRTKYEKRIRVKQEILSDPNTIVADKKDLEKEIPTIRVISSNLQKQSDLIYEKNDLIVNLIKICRKEELNRTRQKFATRLQELMEEKDLDSSHIKAWLGIKQQTFFDYENGNTLPENAKIVVLSKKLNCSVDYLLGLSNLRNYSNYRSHVAFKKFGFSAKAFNIMADLKSNNIWKYAHLINALNHLLEENGIKTLNYVSEYLNKAVSDDYYTVRAQDIDKLQDVISKGLEEGQSAELIKAEIERFKESLPGNNISEDEAKALIDIQNSLVSLKNAINESYLGKDIYTRRVLQYMGEQWVSDNDTDNDLDGENVEDLYFEETEDYYSYFEDEEEVGIDTNETPF